MSSFGEDNANPFARPSPWPSLGAQPMRVGVPPRATPAPLPEPEPEPEPSPQSAAPRPRFIVVDQPVFRAAPAAPQVALETLSPVRAPEPAIEPEPQPAPEPVAEASAPVEPVAPQLALAEAPLAQPILRERVRTAPPKSSAWRWRLGPLLGAAVAGAAAVGALFFLIGRETAATDARSPARGLTPGQIVAPVASAGAAAPAVPAPTAPAAAAPRPTQVATATPAPHAVRAPAQPIRLDVPAMASAAISAPPPKRELAATAAPGPVAAPPPSASVAPPPSAEPAKPYSPPAPPAADAPFVHHVPD